MFSATCEDEYMYTGEKIYYGMAMNIYDWINYGYSIA
jgi:hypothetical protein